ncbi:MAG TPA: thiamine pyrophosphate-binding protein [Candidatus Dormibacteraeota bacterium]|nr:thiamine pyrophosphate-binding protein [Candidatus Dormibacteraeota bacterium]
MRVSTRIGGHLVVESLTALGAEAVFGLPGIHALPVWDALRTSPLRTYGFRTELNAGFAACGWAHVTGSPSPLVVSTGPGALNSLAAVMEAASSHLPVVAIASQIPSDLVGKNRGFLHELPDQSASFRPIVKSVSRALDARQIPGLIAAAYHDAIAPPSGPTYVEIPVDLLSGATSIPVPNRLDTKAPAPEPPSQSVLAEVAELLSTLPDPVILAGGGVIRSAAWNEVVEVAEILDAPVAMTYMGKGSIPADHPLSAGSACDDAAYVDLLGRAGVVLCVGTQLGAEATAQYRLRFAGRLVQIDAESSRIGVSYPALPLVGDARLTLRALVPLLKRRSGNGATRARTARALPNAQEVDLLRAIRAALPRDAITAWDMTILGYLAAAHFPVPAPRTFLYPLGSGTLGFALPGALGAKAAMPDRTVLAVVGDGGFMYGLSELMTARQNHLAVKLLLVDDGGYGILREYQTRSFEKTHGVDLIQPDFEALIASCGWPVRTTARARLESDLMWALGVDGPAALVLHERLVYAA